MELERDAGRAESPKKLKKVDSVAGSESDGKKANARSDDAPTRAISIPKKAKTSNGLSIAPPLPEAGADHPASPIK